MSTTSQNLMGVIHYVLVIVLLVVLLSTTVLATTVVVVKKSTTIPVLCEEVLVLATRNQVPVGMYGNHDDVL